MIIRKLEQNEHGKTRELWEQVFPEDTKEFLDYYYFVKARDNQIYVIEEEGEIRSMLQLNPYEIRIENRVFPSFYIIAVAFVYLSHFFIAGTSSSKRYCISGSAVTVSIFIYGCVFYDIIFIRSCIFLCGCTFYEKLDHVSDH